MARKKDAATKKGAADDKQPNPHETQHAMQMEELAKQSRQHRDAEFAAQGMTPVPITDELYENRGAQPTPEPTPAPTPTPEPIPEPTPAPVDDEYELVKIDGVETRVEKAKVYETGKRALQKELTADKRLQDVSTREQDLARREQEVQRQADELNARLANSGDDELPLEIKYGSDDKTAAGLKRLVKAVHGAKATKGSELTKAEVRAIAREERMLGSFESALEQIKKPQSEGGYLDLFDGGILENAFGFEDERLSKDPDGSKLPYLDRMKKAGENVRKQFGKPTKSSPNNDSDSNAQRNAELGDTVIAAGGGDTAGKPKQQRAPESESQRQARLLNEANQQRRGTR
jgi:hypothetical protein